MSYKYLLFDIDGTLIDSSSGITRSLRKTLLPYGIDEPDEFYHRFIGPPFLTSADKILHFTPEKAQEAVEVYRVLQEDDEYLLDIKILGGVKEGLKALKEAGFHMSAATCRPQGVAERLISHAGLSEYLEHVVGLYTGGINTKADTINFVRSKYPEADIKEFVMIGDRDQDMMGAREAGVDAIAIRTGFAEKGELEAFSPVYIARDFKELTDYLLK